MFGQNAPNPNITDRNDPRYTELSQHQNRWVTAGLIGDVQTFSQRGWDQYFIDENLQEKIDISVGDHVFMANREGVVTAFTLNDDGNRINTITVREDLSFVPGTVEQGYNADGISRTVTYLLLNENDSEDNFDLPNANSFLYSGTLLVRKKRTDDPNEWDPINQSILQNNTGDMVFLIKNLAAPANHCDEETPELTASVFSDKETLDLLEENDEVWMDANKSNKLPNGIYYAGDIGPGDTPFYFAVNNGIVVELPECVVLDRFLVEEANHCENETPLLNTPMYSNIENVYEIEEGDYVFTDEAGTTPFPDGVYYAGEHEDAPVYFAVENGIVVELPLCD